MRLGKTTLIHFGSQVVVSVTGFVATFAIAYLLGSEGLGRYTTIVALAFWLVIPANAVKMATKKRMSEGAAPGEFFAGGLVVNACISVLLTGVVAALAALLGPYGPESSEFAHVILTYTWEVAGLVVGLVFFETSIAALHGNHRVGRASVLKATERTLRVGVQIVLLMAGYQVLGLALGHVMALGVMGAIALVLVGIRPSLPSAEHVESILVFARYGWLSSLQSRVFGWMDTIVLSFFVSASLIGIYEAAWGIASLLAVVSTSISQTLFPEVSELSVQDDYERIKHFLNEALAFTGIFVIPGLFGAAVLGDRILRFYRPEFAEGTSILLVLIAGYIADVFGMQFVNFVNAIDHPDRAFRVNLLFIVSNMVLNVALVWSIGWYGAAIATSLSTTLRAAYGYYTVVDVIGRFELPLRDIGHQVVASLLMSAVVVQVVELVPDNRLGTVAAVFVGAVLYTVALLALSTRVRTKARSFVPVRP